MKFLLLGLLIAACGKSNEATKTADPAPAKPPTAPAKPVDDKPSQKAEEDEVMKIHLEEKKRRMAAGMPEPVQVVLQTLADGTFDVPSQIDPTSAFVYLDYVRNPASEREICGSDKTDRADLTKDLAATKARVAKALADHAVDCGPVVDNHVQCSIGSSTQGDGSLIFAFEIVLGDAQLRRFARERLTVTVDDQVRDAIARRDAALAKPVRKICRSS